MLTTSCLILALSAHSAAGVWPGFLGAGATPADEALPVNWSPTEHRAWKASLPGHGQSSPVVWENQVFVTAVEGPMKEQCHVLAIDLATGKELWRRTVASSDPVKNTVYVSRAAPTPVVDARAVYAFFESGDVVAYSHTGEKLWTRSLAKDYGKFQNKFGLAASPVQTDDAVILLVDDEGPSYLIALAKSDGKNLWKTARTSRVSWSSPALARVENKLQVVCSSAGSIDGYDPATGAQLWTYTDVGGNTAATPLPAGPGRFLVGASMGRDGENAENAKKSNMAMTIEMVEGKPVARPLWHTEEALSSFGSPVVIGGLAYWVNRAGVLFCFDAETGAKRYQQRLPQSCWATPIGVKNRIYFFGKDGTTSVISAGPEFKLLAENQLWNADESQNDPAAAASQDTPERKKAAGGFSGPIQYGAAAVGDRLLIRTGDALYCLKK